MKTLLLGLPLSLTLALTSPARAQGADDCASATPIAGLATFAYDTTGATTDGSAHVLCGFETEDDIPLDVWFRWTAEADGAFEFWPDAAPPGGAQTIAIYADGCAPGNPLDCQAFYPARLDGALAGTSYLVRLGSVLETVGTLTVTAADALPAPVLNPANGNHYRVVSSLSIGWDNAKLRAENETFMGVSGHLATIGDADENAFVYGLGPDDASLCWLGGFQDLDAPDYAEPAGGWRWVTGEPWCYANWSGGGPLDQFGAEDFLAFGCGLCGPEVWADYQQYIYSLEFAQGYVVEFETGAPCIGAAGTTYCSAGTHSLGAEARICAVGSPVIADEALCLSVVDLPPGTSGLFFFGAGSASVPLDNGFRCVVGSPRRMVPPQVADASGRASLHIDLGSPPLSTEFTPGTTRYFQFWYRDGAAGANLSDGVAVTFE